MTSVGKSAEKARDSAGERQRAMGLLAKASRAELQAAYDALAARPVAQPVRGPETGLVMVRGRMGGGGAPFNLGEATVSRAAVALVSGEVGFGHVLGRDTEKARLAAIADALWQSAAHRSAVEALLAPIRARIAAEKKLSAERTAATRVDFFTLVRGED